jgi:hypothetical protein
MSTLNVKSLTASKTLNIPSYTTTQRDALTPTAGQTIYNTTDSTYQTYTGTEWLSGGGLYSFTTATFTSGGISGRYGPSLTDARTGLTGPETSVWKSNTQFFNTSSGIQLWTVPKTGTYTIEVWGARGGNATNNNYWGGYGARMKGTFSLTAGAVLKILVGQSGGASYGGGGGMTAVATSTNTPLIVAGGGNCTSPWSSSVSNATTSTTGVAIYTSAGSNGNGGNSSAGAWGGAGFTGNPTGTDSCNAGARPSSFINGGDGAASCNSIGGFGGGSPTDGCCYGASGAGGGYSGGSGTTGSGQYGGGGGSYNSGTNQSNDNGGTGSATLAGNGKAIITFVA